MTWTILKMNDNRTNFDWNVELIWAYLCAAGSFKIAYQLSQTVKIEK